MGAVARFAALALAMGGLTSCISFGDILASSKNKDIAATPAAGAEESAAAGWDRRRLRWRSGACGDDPAAHPKWQSERDRAVIAQRRSTRS